MQLYPYSAAFILSDVAFVAYGGNIGNSTVGQRNAAYFIAEKEVSEMLETFLQPTIVTGTYLYNPAKGGVMLDHTYINQVYRTEFIDTEEDIYWTQNGTANVYVSLRDDNYGLVDLHYLVGNCHCHSAVHPFPYKVRETYNAGLPTGTTTQADFLLGLTTYAQIILNEIIGFGNEAPGDIGVQNFKNQGYSEERVYLFKTALGSSPKAHFANRTFNKYKKRRYVGM